MRKKQTPVGGKLVNRKLKGNAKKRALEQYKELPKITISRDIAATVEMIATGVLSPVEGFMGQEDYQSVLDNMRLANGIVWTMPQIFAPKVKHEGFLKELKEGQDVALVDKKEEPIAILHLDEKFTYNKKEQAEKIFTTTDREHPGVDNIFRNMGDVCLAGKVDLIERPSWGPFEQYRLEPEDTWRIFYEENKWRTVAGFQTANPVHRGHEYLQKCALELLDGLFIHPIVETTRKEYFRNEFRMKAYEVAINLYYPKERVVLAPLRVTMNYAGPREAILHALIRRNFGCTHMILGRDHAGFRDYYSKYAAQELFEKIGEDELGIEPMFFRHAFYCARCGSMATEKTCPHGPEYHITSSGTGIRDLIRYGYIPPKEVTRPEVTQIAMQGIQPKGTDEGGMAIKMPGVTVKGLFPYYLTHYKLGGYKRDKPLDPTELTIKDLEAALRDARENASEIYSKVYWEIAHAFDISRNIADKCKSEALEISREIQMSLIKMLEEKLKYAEEQVDDKFMYQDKKETLKELETAKKILEMIPKPIDDKRLKERVWNPLDYDEYRR